jgi:dCTP deaminase
VVLNDTDIRDRIINDELITLPKHLYSPVESNIYEASIQPCSYDLTLSKNFKRIKKHNCDYPNKSYVDLCDPVEYIDMPYDGGSYSGVVVHPNEFILGSSNEVVTLPNDVAAMLITRSSFGRMGLMFTFANWIDPGYVGSISMQIYNASPNPIRLIDGIRVAQLVFLKLSDTCEKAYVGKYQHTYGVSGSNAYMDREVHK